MNGTRTKTMARWPDGGAGTRMMHPLPYTTERWYISGRNNEFFGRFTLNAMEFRGIQSLIPMVVQAYGDKLEVTCVNENDAFNLQLILCAIRTMTLYVGWSWPV